MTPRSLAFAAVCDGCPPTAEGLFAGVSRFAAAWQFACRLPAGLAERALRSRRSPTADANAAGAD